MIFNRLRIIRDSIFRLLNFNFLLTLKEKSFTEPNLIFSTFRFFKKLPNKIFNCFMSKLFSLVVTFPLTKNKSFFSITSINEDDRSISLRIALIFVKEYLFLSMSNSKFKFFTSNRFKKLNSPFLISPFI